MSVDDRIQELEERLAQTPKNKGTETARAQLKAAIAKLKEKKEAESGGGGGSGYAVKHRGDATVALVGPPSVGKTSLLNRLTNTEAETASYEFTTVQVNPGMTTINGAQIQVLDVPGLVGGAGKGRGGGKQILSVVRNVDLLLLVTDVNRPGMIENMEQELADADIYVNRERPDIKVEERDRGGLTVKTTVDLDNVEALREAFQEYGYVNANITVRDQVTVEEALAAVSPRSTYLPAVPVINKIDTGDTADETDAVRVSAETGEGLDVLRDRIWEALAVMPVFLKEPGEDASDTPLIVAEDATVEEVAAQIHTDAAEDLRHARVWGESSDFPGQQVGKTHVLQAGDTVELRY